MFILTPFMLVSILSILKVEANQIQFMRDLSQADRIKLNNLECRFYETPFRNHDGFARWTDVYLNCPNLDISIISTVLCDRDCYDPEECYELDNSVRVKPVMVLQTLIARDGTSVNVELPVACQCVASSKETCRSYDYDA
ncbi:unnamed protein product [Clavelina lepadiformis]|uniref:Uncharacterized protein n=1 Tax=Clavelina lepadiformis TaxID=159417 RepID=A0ABP0H2Y0_CLALP